MTKRFLLASVGVVLLSGAATAVLTLNEVGKLVDALGQSKAVRLAPKVLAPTTGGAPETLLLVGNDQRPPPKSNPGGSVLPHSNEMLLVRIDPSKPTISMLSIPRELQVAIYPPGQLPVVTRINAAYTLGGIQLMTETIKRVLGVSVNHVFVVTFPKFRRAVDEMGCVYMTVDRRYHHVNESGGEQYFEINLQPGYQRLCGRPALEFVANRHEDTSLTRDARDQRFLLEVKAQYGATLFENRERFERILGKAVETDLHGTGRVLELLELLVQSQGKPVRQVRFQVNLLPTYDTATEAQIQESVQSFLNGTAPISKHKLNGALHAARQRHHANSPGVALATTSHSELAQARAAARRLPFPLQYPRTRDSSPGARADTLRLYGVRDPRGHVHPIYTIVIDRGAPGEFYDVQGTSWADPPLLSNPSRTVRVGRRTYGLFYTGEQIRGIAWREGNAAYWIQNTLTDSVSPQAMLATAAQTLPVAGGFASLRKATARSHGFSLPPRKPAATSMASRIGSWLGFAGLAVVALLALLVLNRQRELLVVREQLTRAMALEARQGPLLAAAGIAQAQPAPAESVGRAPTTPTIYRARRRWRGRALAGAGVALLGILVAVGIYVLPSGSSSPSAPSGFAIPVAIYNATGSPGAARGIAGTLKANRVPVGRVGDLNANLAHGAYVLYPPGAHAEAQRLARLIPSLAPTITPIQPPVQNVVGRQNEIVIVLD